MANLKQEADDTRNKLVQEHDTRAQHQKEALEATIGHLRERLREHETVIAATTRSTVCSYRNMKWHRLQKKPHKRLCEPTRRKQS